MPRYRCIQPCQYKNKTYVEGKTEVFDEPMNPDVWENLEGEQIDREEFIEYCKMKKLGKQIKPQVLKDVKYTMEDKGGGWYLIKNAAGEVVEESLRKDDAEKRLGELNGDNDN